MPTIRPTRATARRVALVTVGLAAVTLPASAQALNPQPEPPGFAVPGIAVMHNPPDDRPAAIRATPTPQAYPPDPYLAARIAP